MVDWAWSNRIAGNCPQAANGIRLEVARILRHSAFARPVALGWRPLGYGRSCSNRSGSTIAASGVLSISP